MIVVTGAAGFIGSCLVKKLNDERFFDLILVDDFSRHDKIKNLENKKFREKIHRDVFIEWAKKNGRNIEFIFHLGARTDTTLFDKSIFDNLNLNYSKAVWQLCIQHAIPLVYASSAATYGDGTLGYNDSEEIVKDLQPLNPYGDSKNDFDLWAIEQDKKPMFWAGLKFFNVYGPNEYHKGRMASVVFHTFNQIKALGEMKLFQSHNPNYENGMQLRDFIYVKDVVDVCYFLMHNRYNSGLFNLGTGKARPFLHLAKQVFISLGLSPKIGFVPTPEDIRGKYQYFTEAKMEKLKSIGYDKDFLDLELGVHDYVTNYLKEEKYF